MKYHVAHIALHFDEQWQEDVFIQSLFDAGFDTFDGHDAYIPSELWTANQTAIETLFAETPNAQLISIEPCPDENWNATWEAEHPIQDLPLGIRIVPHCAFGAGHHETTSMMIEALMNTDLHDKRVLDHGTGTGVLAIFAKRLGAAHVLALDIDDKSVLNAQENAALNNEDIEVNLCGPVLESLNLKHSIPSDRALGQRTFNIILANIHRNILLANMPSYAACLAPGGELWLSGFYEADIPALIASAEPLGLQPIDTRSNGDWRLLKLANLKD
jgi:ribosomal protein L11 methyltransferase